MRASRVNRAAISDLTHIVLSGKFWIKIKLDQIPAAFKYRQSFSNSLLGSVSSSIKRGITAKCPLKNNSRRSLSTIALTWEQPLFSFRFENNFLADSQQLLEYSGKYYLLRRDLKNENITFHSIIFIHPKYHLLFS